MLPSPATRLSARVGQLRAQTPHAVHPSAARRTPRGAPSPWITRGRGCPSGASPASARCSSSTAHAATRADVSVAPGAGIRSAPVPSTKAVTPSAARTARRNVGPVAGRTPTLRAASTSPRAASRLPGEAQLLRQGAPVHAVLARQELHRARAGCQGGKVPGAAYPPEAGQLQDQPSGEAISFAEMMQRFGRAPTGDDQRGRSRTVTAVKQGPHLLGKGPGVVPVEAQRTRGADVEARGAGLRSDWRPPRAGRRGESSWVRSASSGHA